MNSRDLIAQIENSNFDSMSLDEKIDNIEKQMYAVYCQLIREKDDIVKISLSDKYLDLSKKLEDLKKQSQKNYKDREKQDILKEEYYKKQHQLDEYIKIIDEEIKNIEAQFKKSNISYKNQYMNEDYDNMIMLRKKLQNQQNNLKYKFENNILTIEILNEISIPDIQINQKTSFDKDFNTASMHDTNKNSYNLKKQIEKLEKELDENAKKLEEAFRKRDMEVERIARKERKDLLDTLMELKYKRLNNMSYISFSSDSSNDENNLRNSDNEENNNLNPEENDEEKKKARKQKIKKNVRIALAGSVGVIAGVGLSLVIQPGTSGVIISVGRLGYSLSKKIAKKVDKKIRVCTEKMDENSRIKKIIGKVYEVDNKFQQSLDEKKEKFKAKNPVIMNMVSTVNNLLKKPETQVFLNGVAIGYTIGKISQTIYKWHEAKVGLEKVEQSDIVQKSEVTKTEPKMMKDIPDIDQKTTPTKVITPPDSTPTFDPTKPVDLSSIGEGYVSSYSSDPVSLITSVGKNAMFDKINVVDGQAWVHFTQANGAGYAWFPADEVLKALDLSDISELTGNISGGMKL